MSRIERRMDTHAESFAANREHHDGLLKTLRERIDHSTLGAHERLRARHHQRGKILVRDRVDLLVDPGTPFLNCPRWQHGANMATRFRARAFIWMVRPLSKSPAMRTLMLKRSAARRCTPVFRGYRIIRHAANRMPLRWCVTLSQS